MKPTRLEVIEFTLILALLPLIGWLVQQYPRELPVGKWVGFAAALILSQSLLRDVMLWCLQRRAQKDAAVTPNRKIGCLCAESTVGLSLALAAITLSLLGLQQKVQLSPLQGVTWGGILLGVGFFTKNYVIIIRKEKDHGSINVW